MAIGLMLEADLGSRGIVLYMQQKQAPLFLHMQKAGFLKTLLNLCEHPPTTCISIESAKLIKTRYFNVNKFYFWTVTE